MRVCLLVSILGNMSESLAHEHHVDPDAVIGERIHQLLWRKRISQSALAARIGMTQSGMSKKLRGERPWYAGELIGAAAVLDVTVGYLFGEGDEGPTVGPGGIEPPTSTVESGRLNPIVHLFGERPAEDDSEGDDDHTFAAPAPIVTLRVAEAGR